MIQRIWYRDKTLIFRKVATTSRDTLFEKTSHFIFVQDENGNVGIGECSPIYGLSPEVKDKLIPKINEVITSLNLNVDVTSLNLDSYPSLRFALETAFLDLEQGGKHELYQTAFTRGIQPVEINGLIWMSEVDEMKKQIREKVEQGFSCIKLKIGSNDFKKEVDLLKWIRREFGKKIELRLDANGAFPVSEAAEKLNILSQFNIHSIEQVIRQGQWAEMAELAASSPVPLALDEELIGIPESDISKLLQHVKPAYIILKPTLLGGMKICEKWIGEAEKLNIGWWVTSALESNIGLNAIAQWVSHLKPRLKQGLGTGNLYKNNIPSPLFLRGDKLYHDKKFNWDFTDFFSE